MRPIPDVGRAVPSLTAVLSNLEQLVQEEVEEERAREQTIREVEETEDESLDHNIPGPTWAEIFSPEELRGARRTRNHSFGSVLDYYVPESLEDTPPEEDIVDESEKESEDETSDFSIDNVFSFNPIVGPSVGETLPEGQVWIRGVATIIDFPSWDTMLGRLEPRDNSN